MVVTNAQHNRKQAIRLFAAGFTAAEIAASWGRVWKLSADGKISQIYDDVATLALHRSDKLAAECGLTETSISMSSTHVTQQIKERKAK